MTFPTLLPALITPFDSDGAIDVAAHRHNVETLAGLGLEGFLIGGSTGEGPLLEPGERAGLVSEARATLGDTVHLMVGVVGESVRQAAAQIREAADAGASSFLVLTPVTLARNSVDAQRRYFTSVAETSPLPTLLYSVPRNTGYPLDEAAAIELSAHPNIVGMKDSGADAVRIGRIARAAGPEFTVFNGASASVTLAIAGGAHGAITASTNYLPKTMRSLVDAARHSPASALEIQDRVTSITGTVERHGVPGVKAAAGLIGLHPGHVRPPLADLPDPTPFSALPLA